MFDWKKPTVEMLGRWQPWHDGHTALFKKALKKTGQVCIMYRDVGGVHAGVEGQNDNPFQFEEVKKNITAGLAKYGYVEGKEYIEIGELSFEDAMEELENITESFEDGDSTLENAVNLYNKGVLLKKHCEKKLKEAKKKIDEAKENDTDMNKEKKNE